MTTTLTRPRVALSRGGQAKRAALELIPAYLIALVLLPFIISGGHAWPWNPATIDMQVYVYAVKDLLAGNDIFQTVTPVWHLYFIYPPIAAILMIPLAFGPYVMWQLLWAGGLLWAQWSVLKRCGVPRGAKMAVIMIAVVVAVEPLRTTIGYGQVNTLLMAFVVIDLLPDPADRPDHRDNTHRRIPRGILIGLAASIKLTPALFVVFLLLLGRKREALWGIASFVFFTGIGAIFQPQQTVAFAHSLLGGNTHTASPLYVGNQSLLGVFFRLVGKGTSTTLLGLPIAGIVALIAVVVAAHWWRQGAKVFAVGLVGLATCLASPLSWTHHYVWILPLGVAVLQQIAQLRWPASPDDLSRNRLPVWVTLASAVWVLWVCVCLPLAALPYGHDVELTYNAGQEVIANFGPVLGAVIIIGLAVRLVGQGRSAAAGRSGPAVSRPEPAQGSPFRTS